MPSRAAPVQGPRGGRPSEPGEELEDEVRQPVPLARVVNRHDVRVVADERRCARFPREPRPRAGVARELSPEHLDRNLFARGRRPRRRPRSRSSRRPAGRRGCTAAADARSASRRETYRPPSARRGRRCLPTTARRMLARQPRRRSKMAYGIVHHFADGTKEQYDRSIGGGAPERDGASGRADLPRGRRRRRRRLDDRRDP